MTYNDDPGRSRRAETGAGLWIAGVVAVCLVLGLVVFATTRPTGDTAVTQNPATTTGSGTVTQGTNTPKQPAKPLPNPNAPAAPKQ